MWVDLGRQGGDPCIYGHRLPTHIVAGIAWEAGIEHVRKFYSYLTDAQIIGACWYEVAHGRRRKWRKTFPDWPKEWDEDEWWARPQKRQQAPAQPE